MRFIQFLCICIALAGCASELHTSSSLDQEMQKTDVGHAEGHAQASDDKAAKSDQKTADVVKDERNEGPVAIDDDWTIHVEATPTKPARTIEHHHHEDRGPVATKHDEQKTASVRASMTDDAKSMFDGSADTSSKTVDTTKKKDELGKKSKPSLGFLAALTPYLMVAGAVIALIAFAWLTHGNPIAIAGKVLAWILSKVRGQTTAG